MKTIKNWFWEYVAIAMMVSFVTPFVLLWVVVVIDFSNLTWVLPTLLFISLLGFLQFKVFRE